MRTGSPHSGNSQGRGRYWKGCSPQQDAVSEKTVQSWWLYQTSDDISDDEDTCFDHNLHVHSDELVRDRLSEVSYMPGSWRPPSLGTKVMDRVRDSPRLAKRAMSKMTSPMVSRKKKEDEIYIITLHVIHSSGLVGSGEGRSDAW